MRTLTEYQYVITVQGKTGRGKVRTVTVNDTYAPPPGQTRDKAFEAIYTGACRAEKLRDAAVLFFSLEPNTLGT